MPRRHNVHGCIAAVPHSVCLDDLAGCDLAVLRWLIGRPINDLVEGEADQGRGMSRFRSQLGKLSRYGCRDFRANSNLKPAPFGGYVFRGHLRSVICAPA